MHVVSMFLLSCLLDPGTLLASVQPVLFCVGGNSVVQAARCFAGSPDV